MGLNYSTNSASVRFLGVFAKHCYDQRSWSVQGGAKHILLQIRSTMISENKQSSKMLAGKTDSILFGLIGVLVIFGGILHIFLALRCTEVFPISNLENGFGEVAWRSIPLRTRRQLRSCWGAVGQKMVMFNSCGVFCTACRGWFTNQFHSAQCDIFLWMTRQSWCYNRICQLAFPTQTSHTCSVLICFDLSSWEGVFLLHGDKNKGISLLDHRWTLLRVLEPRDLQIHDSDSWDCIFNIPLEIAECWFRNCYYIFFFWGRM